MKLPKRLLKDHMKQFVIARSHSPIGNNLQSKQIFDLLILHDDNLQLKSRCLMVLALCSTAASYLIKNTSKSKILSGPEILF